MTAIPGMKICMDR